MIRKKGNQKRKGEGDQLIEIFKEENNEKKLLKITKTIKIKNFNIYQNK